MRVCVILQNVSALSDVEDTIFRFTAHLEKICDSIGACDVIVEGPSEDQCASKTWSVQVALSVLGEVVKVVSSRSMDSSKEALAGTLQELQGKCRALLRSIARNHCGCACHQTGKKAANSDC